MVQTRQREAVGRGIGDGAGAGREVAGTVFNQVASGGGAGGFPGDGGTRGGHVRDADASHGDAGGNRLNHQIVDEVIVVVEGIPEGDVTCGAGGQHVEREGDGHRGRRGVDVRTNQSVERHDILNRSRRVAHQTDDEAHIVAALHEGEASLQGIQRGIHLGHNQVAAVVDEAKLVGLVASEADDVGQRIAGAEFGGTDGPAVAAVHAIVRILEVLGVGHRDGSALGGGSGEAGHVVVAADGHHLEFVVKTRIQTGGGVGSGVDSVHQRVDSVARQALVDHPRGLRSTRSPIELDGGRAGGIGHHDRSRAGARGEAGAAHEEHVQPAAGGGAGGRSGNAVGTGILIGIARDTAGDSGDHARVAAGPAAGHVTEGDKDVVARVVERRGKRDVVPSSFDIAGGAATPHQVALCDGYEGRRDIGGRRVGHVNLDVAGHGDGAHLDADVINLASCRGEVAGEVDLLRQAVVV